jgi:hypothetical protein
MWSMILKINHDCNNRIRYDNRQLILFVEESTCKTMMTQFLLDQKCGII